MNIEYIKEFNDKFGLPDGHEDVLTGDTATTDYRIRFIVEELGEFIDAMDEGDRVKAFDALLDLVYVAQGTALFLGISPLQWFFGMSAVHEANMSKIRVQKITDSKRKSSFDVVKPDGWVGPEERLADILT